MPERPASQGADCRHDERSLLEAMADTMRGVLMQANSGPPFYLGGAMKQQMREDLTAYDLLHLDEVPR